MRLTPIVTLTRSTWRALVASAVGAVPYECYGYLVGHPTRAGYRVTMTSTPATVKVTTETLEINDEDDCRAREALARMYAPDEVVGSWHSHPYEEACAEALCPQVSDPDLSGIADGDIEVICIVFPEPDFRLKASDYIIQRRLNGTLVRAEGWLYKHRGWVKACPMRVR